MSKKLSPTDSTRSQRRLVTSVSKALLIMTAATSSNLMLAQDASDVAEEIVVTSSRLPLPLRQIGTSVSVLDEAAIESHGNVALADVLRQMPAIGSSSNGGIGKSTNVRIRGEEGFRTLTLLDGMRIQDPSSPQISTAFEHLLTDGLSRIEVLRGPQGLAYGADAGGVINMNTRVGEEGFRASIDGQAGRYGTRQVAANISGAAEKIDYFISATDFSTDGFNTRDSDTVLSDDDGYENTSLHARIGFAVTDQWRIEGVHREVDGDNEFDGCFSGGRVDECSSDYKLSASRLAVSYNGSSNTHSFSYNRTESDRESFALGVSSFTAVGEIERWEYIGTATELPGFDLVFGADQEEAKNNNIGRDNTGYFIEYLSDFSDSLFITAGVRHDDNDDFGTNTSHRVSAAWLNPLETGTLKIRAAIGTGFRAPSPSEIAYNNGPFASPPAAGLALAQEESEGWEIGIEYSNEDLRLEAVYFDQEVENAIFFDLAAFSGYLQDIGTSLSQGVELSAEFALSDHWRVLGNYTYNDTERPDGTQRLRRPENLFNAGALYGSSDGKLDFSLYYRSQADSIDNGNIDIPDFDVLDMTASYQVSDAVKIYGRIENVLDENYQEINDYNTAGSAAYVGVNFSLNR